MSAITYDGPARFIGWGKQQFNKGIHEVEVTGDDGTVSSTFTCTECDLSDSNYFKVFGHRSVHSKSKATKAKEAVAVLEQYVDARIEERLAQVREERDRLRKENRELRKRISTFRKALID